VERTHYHAAMGGYTREAIAERAGASVAYVDRLVDLGIIRKQGVDSNFSEGDVRRVRLVRGLEESGLPLEGISAAVRSGDLSFDFMDLPSWDWYGGFVGTSYRQLATESRVPLELLQAIRESMGFARPDPDAPVHEEMLDTVPVFQVALGAGADPIAVERLVRVWGESARRITEAASTFYHAQIESPLLRAGMSEGQVMLRANEAVAAGIADVDRALVALYHGQSEHTWLANVIEAVEVILEKGGLHRTVPEPPAMCFLDLTGYTRLTEERGDQAAAEVAATLGRSVQQNASQHGGRAVKWLGDGVMLYFTDPAEAVVSALELSDRVPAVGLPQAHSGIDAGPIVVQDGDYFGRTVNTAARIAAHAGPGQVLVSENVVRASTDPVIAFESLGPVELPGLARPIPLHRATWTR